MLSHSRWIAERYERMNEQLLTLSSTFIGFIAVELALLGQAYRDTHKHGPVYPFSVAAIALVLSVLSFLIALWSLNFEIPKLSNIQDAIENLDDKQLAKYELWTMTHGGENNRNIQKSLEKENKHINRYYKAGLILGALGQVAVGTFLMMQWL